jgi:hypothetical protein
MSRFAQRGVLVGRADATRLAAKATIVDAPTRPRSWRAHRSPTVRRARHAAGDLIVEAHRLNIRRIVPNRRASPPDIRIGEDRQPGSALARLSPSIARYQAQQETGDDQRE